MSLLISLRSENLKLKRTLSIYLCVAAAIFGPLMSFFEYIDLHPQQLMNQPWSDHFMKGREPMTMVLLPFYIILICALLLQIEYRDKTWKQVLSSPQKLINIFFAKFITLQFMILMFLIGYNLFLVVAVFGVELLHPDLYNGPVNFFDVVAVNARDYFLVAGISAIQFWLSLRFKNFIAPLSIGIGMWFFAAVLLFVFKTSAVQYFPYAYSMLPVMPAYKAHVVSYQWYSIATAVVFLSLAFAEFRVKKVRG